MSASTAILDACVLYPAPLRDLLLWLATSGVYLPRWTESIHEEWIENLLEKRPDIGRKKLENTKRLMEIAVPDALVEKARYHPLISNLSLPDKNDRHVLATAIAAQAHS